MKNITNTLICVLFVIALSGYGFCSFFIEPGIDKSYAVFMDNAEEKDVSVPALMYHLVVRDSKKSGEYVITPEEFESDIVYIKSRGYNPVFVSEVSGYIKGEGVLPQKPVLITFDDGYYNNYLNVFPIIKKHNIKINIAVIGKYTNMYSSNGEINELYTHLTYNHIREMAESGLVEFGNHTYDMHKITALRRGVMKAGLENDTDYKSALNNDFLKVHNDIKDNCGIDMKYFAYPYGFSSKEAESVLKSMGYSAFLTCNEGENIIDSKSKDTIEIKRYNRPSGMDISCIIK